MTSKILLKILKDILAYKLDVFLGTKIGYPFHILPIKSFVKKINIDDLLKSNKVYSVRRSELSFRETFNETMMLREDALNYNSVPSLSVNLLGGMLLPRDAFFNIKRSTGVKSGLEKWPGGSNVCFYEYLNDYSFEKDVCLIYLDVNKLHRHQFPYNRVVDANLKMELAKFDKFIDKSTMINGEVNFLGNIQFSHDPIFLNYWHAELLVFDENDEMVVKIKSKYQKKFCKQIINDIICINSFSKIDNIEVIESSFFLS